MKLGAMKAQLPASLADADLVFGYGAPAGRDAARLGSRRSARAARRQSAGFRRSRRARQSGGSRGAPRRPDSGHEQRRLRRRASEAARRTFRARHVVILYLHGFRSSPNSFKARVLAARLVELGRSDEWCCPMLPVSPLETVALAESLVAAAKPKNVTVIGSSLGGYLRHVSCRETRLAGGAAESGGRAATRPELPISASSRCGTAAAASRSSRIIWTSCARLASRRSRGPNAII